MACSRSPLLLPLAVPAAQGIWPGLGDLTLLRRATPVAGKGPAEAAAWSHKSTEEGWEQADDPLFPPGQACEGDSYLPRQPIEKAFSWPQKLKGPRLGPQRGDNPAFLGSGAQEAVTS